MIDSLRVYKCTESRVASDPTRELTCDRQHEGTTRLGHAGPPGYR